MSILAILIATLTPVAPAITEVAFNYACTDVPVQVTSVVNEEKNKETKANK